MIALTSIRWWDAYSEGTLSRVMYTLRPPYCDEAQASQRKRKQSFQSPAVQSSLFDNFLVSLLSYVFGPRILGCIGDCGEERWDHFYLYV